MALDFYDGFDHVVIGQVATKWTAVTQGTNAPSLDTGRMWGNAFKSVAGSGQGHSSLTKTLATASATVLVGAAFKFSSFALSTDAYRRQLIGIYNAVNGTLHASLFINIDGSLTIARQSGSTLYTLGSGSSSMIVPNVWFHVRFQVVVHDSTGTTSVAINDSAITALTMTGQDTKEGANATATSVVILGYPGYYTLRAAEANHTVMVDDVYIADAADATLGDQKVLVCKMDGAGTTTQGTPNTGSNYDCVNDDTPDGDTTYVTFDAVDEYDTYSVEDVDTDVEIAAVQVNVYGKKLDAGTGTVAAMTRIDSTDRAHGTPVGLGTDYGFARFIYETSPETASDWDPTEFNGTEIGVKKSA